MAKALERIILQKTGAKAISRWEELQPLWSHYGALSRYHLNGALYPSVIVKHVTLPEQSTHPRGWNTARSHARKVRSYQVECHWYAQYANNCDTHTRVPRCLGTHIEKNQFVMVLEDLDLDGFKGVNDTYGHDAGDEVLKQVSDRLLSQVRSNDLVARLSGDEFVIMINSTTKQSVSILAERLVALIQKEIIYKGRQLKVGASIGVHFVEDYDKSMDELLKAADTAMYQAKASGKGRFVINHG